MLNKKKCESKEESKGSKTTFSLGSLEELRKTKNSYVVLMPSHTLINLKPFYLNNIKEGLQKSLKSRLKRYDTKLNGILLGFKNVKVNMETARFGGDGASVIYSATWDCYVFQPVVGCLLEGTVNIISPDHMGCVVHRYFNATILRPQDEDPEHWANLPINFGDSLKFRVKDIDFTGQIPFIEGELTDEYRAPKSSPIAPSPIGGDLKEDNKKNSRKRKIRVEEDILSSTQRPSTSNGPTESNLDFDFLSPIPVVSQPKKRKKTSDSPTNDDSASHFNLLSPVVAREAESNDQQVNDNPFSFSLKSKKDRVSKESLDASSSHHMSAGLGDTSEPKAKKRKKKKHSHSEPEESYLEVSTNNVPTERKNNLLACKKDLFFHANVRKDLGSQKDFKIVVENLDAKKKKSRSSEANALMSYTPNNNISRIDAESHVHQRISVQSSCEDSSRFKSKKKEKKTKRAVESASSMEVSKNRTEINSNLLVQNTSASPSCKDVKITNDSSIVRVKKKKKKKSKESTSSLEASNLVVQRSSNPFIQNVSEGNETTKDSDVHKVKKKKTPKEVEAGKNGIESTISPLIHQQVRSSFSFDGSDASKESDLFRTKKKKHKHSSTKGSFTLDEAGRNVSSFMSPTVIKDFASIQTPVANEESSRRINTSIERSIEAESSEDGGNLTYVVTPALTKSKHSKKQIPVVSTMRVEVEEASGDGDVSSESESAEVTVLYKSKSKDKSSTSVSSGAKATDNLPSKKKSRKSKLIDHTDAPFNSKEEKLGIDSSLSLFSWASASKQDLPLKKRRNSASATSSQGARSASVDRTISAVSLGNLPESESRAKENPEKKSKAPPNQTAEVSELNRGKETIAGKAETPREGAHFQISRCASVVRTMSPDSFDALSTTKIKAKEKAKKKRPNSAAQAPVSPNEKVKSPAKLDTKHLKKNTYIKSPKKKPETAFNEGYVSSDEDSETQRRPESRANSAFSLFSWSAPPKSSNDAEKPLKPSKLRLTSTSSIDAVIEAVASGISDDPLIESSKGTQKTKKGKAQATLAEGSTAHVTKSPKKSGKTTSESMIAMPSNVDETIQDVASGCLDGALPLSSEGRKKEKKQSVLTEISEAPVLKTPKKGGKTITPISSSSVDSTIEGVISTVLEESTKNTKKDKKQSVLTQSSAAPDPKTPKKSGKATSLQVDANIERVVSSIFDEGTKKAKKVKKPTSSKISKAIVPKTPYKSDIVTNLHVSETPGQVSTSSIEATIEGVVSGISEDALTILSEGTEKNEKENVKSPKASLPKTQKKSKVKTSDLQATLKQAFSALYAMKMLQAATKKKEKKSTALVTTSVASSSNSEASEVSDSFTKKDKTARKSKDDKMESDLLSDSESVTSSVVSTTSKSSRMTVKGTTPKKAKVRTPYVHIPRGKSIDDVVSIEEMKRKILSSYDETIEAVVEGSMISKVQNSSQDKVTLDKAIKRTFKYGDSNVKKKNEKQRRLTDFYESSSSSDITSSEQRQK